MCTLFRKAYYRWLALGIFLLLALGGPKPANAQSEGDVELRGIAIPAKEGGSTFVAVYLKKDNRIILLKPEETTDSYSLLQVKQNEVILQHKNEKLNLKIDQELLTDSLFIRGEEIESWEKRTAEFEKLAKEFKGREAEFQNLISENVSGCIKNCSDRRCISALDQLLRELTETDSPFTVPFLLRLKKVDETINFPGAHRIELAKGLLRNNLPGGLEISKIYIEKSEDYIEQILAISNLAYAKPKEAIPLLNKIITADDEQLSEKAAQALVHLDSPGAKRIILQALRDTNNRGLFTQALIPALKGSTDEEIIETAVNILNDKKRKWAPWAVMPLLASFKKIPARHIPMLKTMIPEAKKIQEQAEHAYDYQIELAQALAAAGDKQLANELLKEIMQLDELFYSERVSMERNYKKALLSKKKGVSWPKSVAPRDKVKAAYLLAKNTGDRESLKFLQKIANMNSAAPGGGEWGDISQARFMALKYLFDLGDKEARSQLFNFIKKGSAREQTFEFLDFLTKRGEKEALIYIKEGHDSVYSGNTGLRAAYQRAYKAIEKVDFSKRGKD